MLDVATAEGDVRAYEVKPETKAKGGLIVIHEVWGLNDHTKDIADRFAREGYITLAPDLLGNTLDAQAAGELQENLFNPDLEKRNAAQPKLRELWRQYIIHLSALAHSLESKAVLTTYIISRRHIKK